MTLPTGESPISFSQIRTEFGDGTNTSSSPVRLGQYRRDDASFTNENPGALNLPLDLNRIARAENFVEDGKIDARRD